MNPKIMKRPMFRMGGPARVNYQNGTTLEELIKKQGELRGKQFDTIRQVLPLSVLATQMDDIRTIRKPRDVLNILSNIGASPELVGALTKLPSLDLKIKERELTDKIALAKLEAQKNKKFEFEKRIEIARGIEQTQKNLLAGKSEAEQKEIRASDTYKNLEKQKSSILREMSETDYLFQRSIKDGQLFDIDQARRDFQKIKWIKRV